MQYRIISRFRLVVLGVFLGVILIYLMRMFKGFTSVYNKLQQPVSNMLQPPVSNKLQPPVSNKLQPPVSNMLQPPVSNEVQPPVSNMLQQQAPQTRVLLWKANGWELQKDFCIGNYNFDQIQLKTPAGMTPMFIHPIKKDQYVSGTLKKSGAWEATHLKLFQKMLEKEPEAGVIDVGSQLGTFTLFAAKMGRKVIAVDPLEQNVLRFCKSVQEGRLTGNVTIFYAAVSSSHKKVSFHVDPTNIGGTKIVEVPSSKSTVGNYTKFVSETSLLNDMLEEMHFKKAVMKIDVEGHEYEALKAADRLFKNVDIQGIIMEWRFLKPADGKKLVDLLLGYGFKPMDLHRRALSPEKFKEWPIEIAWKKQ